jgi:hypothetical protein
MLKDFISRWKRPPPAPSEQRFRQRYFAEIPVDLESLPQFRAEQFPQSGPAPWIDQPDALDRTRAMAERGELTESDAAICRQFIVEGFTVAPGLVSAAELDAAWQGYERALAEKVVSVEPESHGENDPYPGRLLDPHLQVAEVRALQWHPEILRICDLLLGRKAVPFQTIIGHKSSQQLAHSDAIHMTTYPPGYLIAAWVAFEDVDPASGPLTYYPRSHRLLPYLLSRDVGIAMFEFKEKGGAPTYSARYEPAVQRYLDAYSLTPQAFCPRKGDVLFWHANLVHGGSIRGDLAHSRKALVCHYFARGAFTYHDLSGNASRLHRNGLYEGLAVDPPSPQAARERLDQP